MNATQLHKIEVAGRSDFRHFWRWRLAGHHRFNRLLRLSRWRNLRRALPSDSLRTRAGRSRGRILRSFRFSVDSHPRSYLVFVIGLVIDTADLGVRAVPPTHFGMKRQSIVSAGNGNALVRSEEHTSELQS